MAVMDDSLIFLLLVISGIASGLLAKRKNRSIPTCFLLGLFIGFLPVIYLIFASYICKECGQKISKEHAIAETCPYCLTGIVGGDNN